MEDCRKSSPSTDGSPRRYTGSTRRRLLGVALPPPRPRSTGSTRATEGAVVQSLIQVHKALGGGWQIRWDNSGNQTAAVIAQPTALAAILVDKPAVAP